MKKSLVTFTIILILTSLQAGNYSISPTKANNSIESLACKYCQCSATAKSTG